MIVADPNPGPSIAARLPLYISARRREDVIGSGSGDHMEEFQEADVLWPDHHGQDDGNGRRDQRQWPCREQPRGGGEEARRRPGSSSAPVGIPGVSRSWVRSGGGGDDDDDDGVAPFVRPHEVAARRRCAEAEARAASSVCVGHGRTLKGRDLRCVRTAVLRMTGFLEN